MKIDSSTFCDFLEKISVLEKAILNFNENGLEVIGLNPEQTIGLQILLPKKKILEYEAVGEIGIDDISSFLNKVGILSGNLNLIINEKKYLKVVSGNSSLEMILPDISLFEKSNLDLNKINPEITFSMPIEILKNIAKDSDALKSDRISFDLAKDGNLTLTTKTQTDTFQEKYFVSNAKIENDIHVDISSDFLKNVIKTLSGTVNIGLKSNYPLVLAQNSDIEVKYIISPRMSE